MFEFIESDSKNPQKFVLLELYKIQNEQIRDGRKLDYIGVRSRNIRSWFRWTEIDTIKFYAVRVNGKWECYNFETSEQLLGTEKMFSNYMSQTTTTDDFSKMIEDCERVI